MSIRKTKSRKHSKQSCHFYFLKELLPISFKKNQPNQTIQIITTPFIFQQLDLGMVEQLKPTKLLYGCKRIIKFHVTLILILNGRQCQLRLWCCRLNQWFNLLSILKAYHKPNGDRITVNTKFINILMHSPSQFSSNSIISKTINM